MFIEEIAKKRITNFNEKAKTEEDAYEFCRSNKVIIADDRRTSYGKYLVYKDHHFILINPKLKGIMKLWVLWHEIAHFILHTPETNSFSGNMVRKNDKEANIIASVCLLPRHEIKNKTIKDLRNDFPFELLKIRKYTADVLKI